MDKQFPDKTGGLRCDLLAAFLNPDVLPPTPYDTQEQNLTPDSLWPTLRTTT